MSQLLGPLAGGLEVVKRDDAVESAHKPPSDLQADPSNVVRLHGSQRRLRDADRDSRRPLGKLLRSSPPPNLSTNAHATVIPITFGKRKGQLTLGESQRYQYAQNVATVAKKVSPAAADALPKPGRGSNRLTEAQELCFRSWLKQWTDEHCVDTPGGKLWSERKIAARLNVSQPEYRKFRDEARIGIQRLLHISRVTGVDILDMLGERSPR